MQKTMKTVALDDIRPYENNPRLNDDAVEAVRKSMEQCGYIAPIVVDEYHVVLAGHTRLKALKEMGAEKCDVLMVEGLSDDEKRKYRLLDNKTNELALWDFDKLEDELEGLDFDDLELDWMDGLDEIDILQERERKDAEERSVQPFEKAYFLVICDIDDEDDVSEYLEGVKEYGADVDTTRK